MSEVRTIYGIDYDDLEPYVKDKYNQRVEWSPLYPEWKEKHPDKKGYGDWDEVFMVETDLDYISNWSGDNFKTYFGITVLKLNGKLYDEESGQKRIVETILPFVNLKKKELKKLCSYHNVLLVNDDEESMYIDQNTGKRIALTIARFNGKSWKEKVA